MMNRITVAVMVITLLSKIVGFLREIVMSYFYGASSISDAFFLSTTIPSLGIDFMTLGLGAIFIPTYTRIFQSKGSEAANSYMSNLMTIITLGFVVLFCFLWVSSGPIVKLLGPGLDENTVQTTIALTRICVSAIIFFGIISISVGFLQFNERFIWTSIIGLPLSVVTIISIYISSHYSVRILAWGFVLSFVSQIVLLIPLVKKAGFKYKPQLHFSDTHIKYSFIMTLPAFLGVSVDQLNRVIDRAIASTVSAGGISALFYANKLILFVSGVFVLTVSGIIFPKLAKMYEKNNIEKMKRFITEQISMMTLILIPITVGTLLFSEEVIQILFGRGAFDRQAVELTATALFFYAFGLLWIGYKEVLLKTYYAMHDTKTPIFSATIGVGINIILNLILSKWMGIGGLALATSISAFITTLLLVLSLKTKLGRLNLFSKNIIKIGTASLIMGGCAKLAYSLISKASDDVFALIGAVCCGMIIYALTAYLLGVDEIEKLKQVIDNK